MKDVFDLYGFYSENIQLARNVVEEVLGKKMIEHDSSYRGEYLRLDIGYENFILQSNFDLSEKECFEKDFANYPVILYVNYTNRSEKLKEGFGRIDKCTLLRHNTYDQ